MVAWADTSRAPKFARWVAILGVLTFVFEVGGILVVFGHYRGAAQEGVIGPGPQRLFLYVSLSVALIGWLGVRAAERPSGRALAGSVTPGMLLEELLTSVGELRAPRVGQLWLGGAALTLLGWLSLLVAFRWWPLRGEVPSVAPLLEMVLGGAAAVVEVGIVLFAARPPEYATVAAAALPVVPELALPFPPKRPRDYSPIELPPAAPGAELTGPLYSEHSSPAPVPQCVACGAALHSNRCAECGTTARAGAFRILKLLGQRAYARTYLAEAPDGTRAALKELLFAHVPDTATLEAFEREAAVLARVSHPRVPRLLGAWREGTGAALRCYLAMSWVEGTPLARVGVISEARASAIARDVLEVLTVLHGREPRILHRDIKPSNLVQDTGGRIHVVDFGAARDVERTVNQGTLVGTVGFMAPEQLAGQVDPTTDLYSLGTTLVSLLSGSSPTELMDGTGAITVPRRLAVSPPFARFLRKLSAARRTDRFGSASAALAALTAPSGDRRVWLALAAVLGAGALIAAVAWGLRVAT